MREQKLARVIDREVAPVWHDRFARLLLRDLPVDEPETFALDIHSGPGHTTAELLQRLNEKSRIVALGRDPWLMQVSKTRVRPEWKRRVYFKSGDIDDVTGMNDDTYSLTIANLVLGEQVVDWQPALAELTRVTKPGGQVLATLPLSGTWREVEDLFEEMLRDEGMRKEVATLQKLRRRRPKASQLVAGLKSIGLDENDYIVEHERFELLFRSGREFLFAPVIEHGPLRLWKAIIGRAEKPQALFWRFKETIDTYYAGHVLAVTVVAGLIRLRVPGGAPRESFAGAYWSRYPSLVKLWGGPGADAFDADDEFEFDLDIDLDEAEAEAAIDALQPVGEGGEDEDDESVELELEEGPAFAEIEVSGVNDLPAVDAALDDGDDDPFSGMLDELDAEAAAHAEIAAADAEVDAVAPRVRQPSGKAATLGAVEHSPLPGKLPSGPKPRANTPPSGARRAGSGASPLPSKLPPKPKGAAKIPPKPKGKLADRLPRRASSSLTAIPRPTKDELSEGGDDKKAALKDRLAKAKKASAKKATAKKATAKKVTAKKATAKKVTAKKAAVKAPPAAKRQRTPSRPPPPKAPPTGSRKAVPKPTVTKPGEEDPFASMLEDDDELEEIDDLEELDDDSLVDGVLDDDDDLEAAFADIAPSPSKKAPPPPPTKKKR